MPNLRPSVLVVVLVIAIASSPGLALALDDSGVDGETGVRATPTDMGVTTTDSADTPNATVVIDNATDAVGPTASGTDATETVDNATETVDTTTSVTDAVETTTSAVDTDTVNTTTNTVDSTSDAVDETTHTVDTVDTAIGTVDATTSDVDTATDALDTTTDAIGTANGSFDGDADVDGGVTFDGSAADEGDGQPGGEPTATPTRTRGDDGTVTVASSGPSGPFGGSAPMAGGAAVAGVGAVGAGLFARRTGALSGLQPVARSATSGAARVASALFGQTRDWFWRLVALGGYQRYANDDPLEHDARAAIYEHLQQFPGSYLTKVSTETGVPLSTVRYHVRVLEFENLVRNATLRGRRRYFPLGTAPNELDAALNDDAPTAVLETLVREGADSVSGLAEKLDRDPSTITHHLQRLEEDGLVERERDGRAVVNRVVPEVEAALLSTATEGDATARPAIADTD